MSGPIFKPAGFLRLATIQSVDVSTMTAFITFRDAISGTDDSKPVPAQLPIAYLSAGGGFIGGWPGEGTPVVVGQAEGASHYFIVSFLARDPAARSSTNAFQLKIPDLAPGEITIQSDKYSSINLKNNSIVIGAPRNSFVFDVDRRLSINTFDYNYFIGQGERSISGVIRRDRKPKTNFPSFLRKISPEYDDTLIAIGMDPVANAKSSNIGIAVRNPARIEKRELIFEYEDFANVGSNDEELEFYQSGKITVNTNILNRRNSRADALSLSLVSPNYLMETIKGTVVDIYGNILDINRNIIPIGKDNLSIFKIKSTAAEPNTFKNVYEQIKRYERKSLAFHFEINSRKELNGSGLFDTNSRDDYARNRSRFFIDVDKEGQIKLNVPASSETGNIGLLTRYENYSTIHPNEKSNNTNDMVFNDNYQDILIEPFANHKVISLKDDLGGSSAPIDRFTNDTYIKHGTAYHDISKIASTYQSSNFYNPFPFAEYIKTTSLGSGRVKPLSDIVSKEIIVSGPNANAGGRSGSFNFDGSIEINIGANTVDKQSLWLDTQGGALVNLGRDLKNNVSLAMNADGHVLLQVGGATVAPEKGRFKNVSAGWIAGVLDIRVFNSNNANGHNEMTVFRIDNEGVTVTTPSRMVFYANGNMLFRSASKIELDAETITLNGRDVIKDPQKGPIR